MGLYDRKTLEKKTKAELAELADQAGIDTEDLKVKSDYIDALMELEAGDEEEVEEEVDVTDDEEVEDDEEEEEDDTPAPAPASTDDDEEDDEEDIGLPAEDEEEETDEVETPKPKAKRERKTKYTDGGKNEAGEALLGAKEVAAKIGTDAKTLRQFFRSGKSSISPVGAGGRYEFAEGSVATIADEFNTWKANKPGRGASSGEGGTKRSRRKGKEVAEADTLEEVEEIEEVEIEELDDEELDLEED